MSMPVSTYPVHVDAHLDSSLSRWMWLLKWLLVIPHYLVLAFLWLAFTVLSVVAFFAILVTGRYPRAIFEFNVGVMRWTWRVAYYAYGALGTDRYPPFSLQERPDYPAHLEVDYPEHLSRGLVLVKWWLLAIPHYLVVGLFVGGGAWVAYDTTRSDADPVWSTGLIGLLTLIAAVVLLFTGRYPQPVFDLVLGLNRWVLRVAGYAALMTDQYPPFRLDQGGADPDAHRLAMTEASPGAGPSTGPGGATLLTPYGEGAGGSTPAPAQPPPPRWTAGRVVALVFGSLLVLTSLGLGVGGAATAFADRTLRDADGFLMSDQVAVSTDSYAITTANLEIEGASALPHRILGDAKVAATPAGDAPVFVGVADTADVQAYLTGVRHAQIRDFADEPDYRMSGGSAAPALPGGTDIWVAQSSGTGSQTITWPVENGDWTVVVMNADGSRGVGADVAAGATVPAIEWVWGGLLAGAGISLVLGVVLIAVSLPRTTRTG